MKIKIFLYLIFIFFLVLSAKSFSAEKNETFDGKGGAEDHSFLNAKNSNFKKGKDALKKALKFEKKNKDEKADKYFNKSLKYFVSARKEYPNNTEILSYLGLAYYKVGDLIMSEIYYKEGLEVEPKNSLINLRLGKLYFNSERKELAKERLKVLSLCNCKEYSDLKNVIKSPK